MTVVLLRHGETEWSLSGQHTGATDIPLTANGRQQARDARSRLPITEFAHVLVSPRTRARDTAELAGLEATEVTEDLVEWDYGDYEGLTSARIQEDRPDWYLWTDGCPGGETPDEVCARVDRLLDRVRDLDGDVCLVAHGHVLRAVGQSSFAPNAGPLALRVEDVDAERARLEAEGVVFGAQFDSGVCHQAIFHDPDGNAIALHHRYAPRHTD